MAERSGVPAAFAAALAFSTTADTLANKADIGAQAATTAPVLHHISVSAFDTVTLSGDGGFGLDKLTVEASAAVPAAALPLATARPSPPGRRAAPRAHPRRGAPPRR
jgi:hypothetical protein